MKLILDSPSKLRIINSSDLELDQLKKFLTYKDRAVQQLINSTKKAYWMIQKYGQPYVNERVDELKKELNKSLLFQDDRGYWTYPGLQRNLSITFKADYENPLTYPESKLVPWDKLPDRHLRPYQEKAVDAMLNVKHGHVEIGTGGGKSQCILHIVKRMGLKTAVVAPSTTIADQLFKLFSDHFGKKNVGMYGGSKKSIDKRITVCVTQSLTRIEPNTEAWDFFQSKEVFIYDESHSVPAATFEKVCQGVLAPCMYRYFFSATQERNDGKDLILQGIIGQCVYSKGIKELQDEGYLAKLKTVIFDVESSSSYQGPNPLKNNQKHLYGNKKIIDFICTYVPRAIEKGVPTLILIDEFAQEEMLRERIGNMYTFASSDSDNKKICDDFNDGKIMCVVGTSAVSTGVDFQRNKLTINWQGNRAGVKVKQGPIGRSTRIHKESGKDSCTIIDFRVTNIPLLSRHTNERIKYYQEVGPVQYSRIE